MIVSIAQISPIWLNKLATIDKAISYINQAADQNSDLVCFGEAFLPGYPHWVSSTGGAEFNSKIQKELYAHYVQESIIVEKGDLDEFCRVAKDKKIAIYLGFMERAADRGSHSLYCSLAYINKEGSIESVHRKLQPTYEERLVWAQGDGNGLQVHELEEFNVGGLNCWENWMPLTRSAMYAQGENLRVAVWPGSDSLTKDITRFLAMESRSYVISASSILLKENISDELPHSTLFQKFDDIVCNGGSCIASPTGEWIIPPQTNEEKLISAELDIKTVFEERQNFDPSGHYSRPDVTKLIINKDRQGII